MSQQITLAKRTEAKTECFDSLNAGVLTELVSMLSLSALCVSFSKQVTNNFV